MYAKYKWNYNVVRLSFIRICNGLNLSWCDHLLMGSIEWMLRELYSTVKLLAGSLNSRGNKHPKPHIEPWYHTNLMYTDKCKNLFMCYLISSSDPENDYSSYFYQCVPYVQFLLVYFYWDLHWVMLFEPIQTMLLCMPFYLWT